MSEAEFTTPVRSILSRLTSFVQDAIEAEFQKADSTVLVDKATGKEHQCLYLMQVVPDVGGDVDEDDITRFSALLTHLITTKLVAHGVLADPVQLKLAGSRWALIWYVFSDYTREELNAKLGCDCFVEEGGIYAGPWPAVVGE